MTTIFGKWSTHSNGGFDVVSGFTIEFNDGNVGKCASWGFDQDGRYEDNILFNWWKVGEADLKITCNDEEIQIHFGFEEWQDEYGVKYVSLFENGHLAEKFEKNERGFWLSFRRLVKPIK